MQSLWAPHLPSYGSVDATTSLHPVQRQQQQQQPQWEVEGSLEASFQAQHAEEDPKRQAESFPSLQGLGEAPALSKDAESSSSLGLGRAPALQHMFEERSSASNSASSSEGHVSSKHKLSAVATQLGIVVICLQECIYTLAELQSDSFDQENASLGQRESSLASLTSSRNISNNNSTQEEKRSSLELTPRTCKSKSEATGSHPELEQTSLSKKRQSNKNKKNKKKRKKKKQHSLLLNKGVSKSKTIGTA